MQNSLTRLNDDSAGTSSPVANGFITKEIFDTHIPSKPAPGKTRDSGNKGSFSRKPEKDPPDPFVSKRPASMQPQGEAISSTHLSFVMVKHGICVGFSGNFTNLLSANKNVTI